MENKLSIVYYSLKSFLLMPRIHFLFYLLFLLYFSVPLPWRNNRYGRLQKRVIALWVTTAPVIIAFHLLAVIPAAQ